MEQTLTKFRVTFYYLATGMEGVPDIRDMGIVEAATKEAAIDLVIQRDIELLNIPEISGIGGADYHRMWMKSCLTAHELS